MNSKIKLVLQRALFFTLTLASLFFFMNYKTNASELINLDPLLLAIVLTAIVLITFVIRFPKKSGSEMVNQYRAVYLIFLAIGFFPIFEWNFTHGLTFLSFGGFLGAIAMYSAKPEWIVRK